MLKRASALLHYRAFLRELVAEEFRTKYRRSALGFLWSLLNPLFTMLILALVFQFMVRLPMRSYALYLLSALIPWTAFATTVQRSASTLLYAEPLIRRYPIPKLVFPASVTLVGGVNLALSLAVLLVAVGPIIVFDPSPALLLLPYALVCLVATALGLSALVALATVYFRDVEHLIGVLLTAWMYGTPILYPLRIPGHESIIPARYHFWFELNPMYHVIQLFVKPIYWGELPDSVSLSVATATAFGGLLLGVLVFWWREDDVVFAL